MEFSTITTDIEVSQYLPIVSNKLKNIYYDIIQTHLLTDKLWLPNK